MERTQIFDLMGELRLYGMKAAFDDIMATAVKRQHEPQRVVGDLLTAEISEKQARSIKYQLTIARLPLAKDLADFKFAGTPINETLVKDLAGGGFIAQQRNVVLVGGTGTGKNSSRHRHCAKLHPRRRSRPVLQCRRSRQSARNRGRVEMWRGGCRLNISVAASFVWRCLSGSAVTPFPHSAHRTGQADLPHPALGQNFTPSPTARRVQAGRGVRARSAHRGARVDRSRPCVA